jgi:hypothetical protein
MSSVNLTDIPNEFICPITLEIMEEPVICSDGWTYEKRAILAIRDSISPITRQSIDKNNIIPNRNIKEAIERFKTCRISTILGSNSHLHTQLHENNITQLIIPEYQIEAKHVRSPWDDKIYKLTFKNSIGEKISKKIEQRYSTTLIAVIDTSGSMGTSCSTGTENDGFTRLDLVKHSMNTVVEMLQPSDELVMIEFNSRATCLFDEKITQYNKPRAKSSVDSLKPNGGTYIWNGLKLAYQAATKSSNNNVHIMLLTDGQSEGDPFFELKRFLSREENLSLKKIKLTTFGFSYDINSKVLFDIAEFTNSGFNFIPDASMVGTSFCNYLANILSPDLYVPEIKEIDIHIQTQAQTQTQTQAQTQARTQVQTEGPIDLTSWDLIASEQKYELIRFHCYQILRDMCVRSGSSKRLPSDFQQEIIRFIEFIKMIIRDGETTPLFTNMLKDFESNDESHEQITKAISRPDWFCKWGYHYLGSLALAHLTRQCHNFKDQGVQLYGSSIFQSLQDQVYQIFSTIPAPKPSLIAQAQVIRTSMSAYVDRSGGCFGPDCKIKLADGTTCPLNKLSGNELVYQGDGVLGAKIKYLVQTQIPNGIKSMCKINNLIISEYHPVFDNKSNGWVFPNQLTTPNEFEMEYMYNIVLESGHWVEIEGFKCVSLGHGLVEFDSTNHILSHDYFGTTKVIRDLENFSNATHQTTSITKIIKICNYIVVRDTVTNLVTGIFPESKV